MFTFLMPTKIIAGENAVRNNSADLILGKRAMIVTGRSSAKKSGALDDVIAVLKDNNIPYTIYDDVENNPTIENCAAGGSAARKFSADFLIGIGGGSPLDATKAIAVYAANEPIEGSNFELFDIYNVDRYPRKPLPMAAVPTTAGTGSEVTPYSILTLHKLKTKKSFGTPDVFYKTAFIDGRYTLDLPLQIARNTAVDAMCHLIEGYTNKKSSPSSDYIALEGLRIIGKNIDSLIDGSNTVESCTELLWASSLGGMVISQTGTTIVHSMGYQLTYYKDIPHGRANGLLLPEYLKRTNAVLPEKISAVLKALKMNSIDELCKILSGILPYTESISAAEISDWAETSIRAKNVSTCPFSVTLEDEIDIYRSALL